MSPDPVQMAYTDFDLKHVNSAACVLLMNGNKMDLEQLLCFATFKLHRFIREIYYVKARGLGQDHLVAISWVTC